MHDIELDRSSLLSVRSKTAIVTGAVGGIGRQIVRLLVSHGANVAIVDLEQARPAAEKLVSSLPQTASVMFVPADISDWPQMLALFKQVKQRFGSIELVFANAAVMESRSTLDIDTDGSRGSIVLTTSTSGYFGATGVAAYIASKHAITGLLRASQTTASEHQIRLNAVAPFVTPTNLANAFVERWQQRGLPSNTPESVAATIACLAVDANRRGACYLVSPRQAFRSRFLADSCTLGLRLNLERDGRHTAPALGRVARP